jgi:hypothetical protein
MVMVQKANAALTAETVGSLQGDADLVEKLGRPGAFLEVARDLLELSSVDLRYLEAIPPAVRDAMRAAIHAAVVEGRAVQISYHPAYEFEARVFDFVSAVGIELHGPYTLPASRESYKPEASRRKASRRAKPTRSRRGKR